jgi:adenylate cyclase
MLAMPPRPPLDGQLAAVLVDAAIAGRTPAAILEGLCRAMVDAGLPLSRAAVGALLVHPLLDATLAVWRAGRGAHVDESPRPAVRGDEAWRHSPFNRMELDDENVMRRRLDRGEGATEFAVLADLAAEGATDYLALRTRLAVGVTPGDGSSIFSSWVTHRAGGFAPAEVDRIRGIEPLLAVVSAAALGTATAGTLLATYLGADAAARILSGDVERGRVEMIHAVIWYSDLAGFTRLTDKVAGAGVLPLFSGYAEILLLLNDHAEILVDAIEARGGQVLKFMGDGLLAIFRAASEEEACEAALSAWIEASGRCEELRRRQPTETHPYLALHAGEVLYGNVGGRTRLDFTVLGHAVNEASRIAALCRPLGQPVLLSEAFADRCPAQRRASLIGLGRHALRGVTRPPMLFALDPRATPRAGSAGADAGPSGTQDRGRASPPLG